MTVKFHILPCMIRQFVNKVFVLSWSCNIELINGMMQKWLIYIFLFVCFTSVNVHKCYSAVRSPSSCAIFLFATCVSYFTNVNFLRDMNLNLACLDVNGLVSETCFHARAGQLASQMNWYVHWNNGKYFRNQSCPKPGTKCKILIPKCFEMSWNFVSWSRIYFCRAEFRIFSDQVFFVLQNSLL